MVSSYVLQLAIFLYSKRGARERREVGPAFAVRVRAGAVDEGGPGTGALLRLWWWGRLKGPNMARGG